MKKIFFILMMLVAFATSCTKESFITDEKDMPLDARITILVKGVNMPDGDEQFLVGSLVKIEANGFKDDDMIKFHGVAKMDADILVMPAEVGDDYIIFEIPKGVVRDLNSIILVRDKTEQELGTIEII